MPANLDSLAEAGSSSHASEDEDEGEVAAMADEDSDAHDRLLGDLKRSLLAGSGRKAETRPPTSAAGMDVHGLRPLRRSGGGGEAEPTRLQAVLSAALGGEAAKRAVGQELRAAQRRHRVLEAPVRLVEAKSQRIAAYERAHKDLGRWYGYVERSRLSEQVSFPLPQTGAPRPQSAADYAQRARADIAAASAANAAVASADDDLESRLYRRLYSEAAIAQAAGQAGQQLSQRHQQLDGAKIRERLASSRRLVARRHFLEEKLKRQARIKSKAYRRHARRARLKQEVAELTALKDSDPGAFAERMAALERARADERISQRHRGGGKFAREQKLRARFDDSARQAVQEMLQRGRELTEKTDAAEEGAGQDGASDSDDEAEAEAAAAERLPADLVDDWNAGRRDAADDSDDAEAAAGEATADVAVPAALRPVGRAGGFSSGAAAAHVKERTLELDLSHLPSLADTANVDDDGELVEAASAASAGRRLARMRTDELLAADGDGADAKEEFEREKAGVADQEQPKDVDLFLAGWNSWTGPGTRPVPAERRQQFLIRAPKRNRRDAQHGHVIIREKLESSATRRRHLVKEVPFPYANAEQFEHAMRAPVCREFNAILAHKRLTAPRVTVRMGRAIGPVPKDAILRRRRRQRTNAEIAKGKK